MDWKSVKFDWNRARAFLVTAEEGSLSAAARALGVTQPTLGRQVSALEKELGVTLFERAGRAMTLTPSGVELLGLVREMGNAASRVSLTASGQCQAIEGTVCISASEIDATFRLPPIIAKLREQEPGIDIEIVVTNQVSDLQRREADIAIRYFRPVQPDLIVKKIKNVNVSLYATKSYLEKVKKTSKVQDFEQLEYIGFDRTDMVIDLFKRRGINLTQRNFPIITSFQILQLALVKKGLGAALFPDDIAITDPDLELIFPFQGPLISLPVWLVCHRELRTSRRVKRVFEILSEELKK